MPHAKKPYPEKVRRLANMRLDNKDVGISCTCSNSSDTPKYTTKPIVEGGFREQQIVPLFSKRASLT